MNYEGKIVCVDFIFKSLKEKNVVVNKLKDLGASISIFLNNKCHILITSKAKFDIESLNVMNSRRYGVNILTFDDYHSIISHLNTNEIEHGKTHSLQMDSGKSAYLNREEEKPSNNMLTKIEDEPKYSELFDLFKNEDDDVPVTTGHEPLHRSDWREDVDGSKEDETSILPQLFHDQEEDKSCWSYTTDSGDSSEEDDYSFDLLYQLSDDKHPLTFTHISYDEVKGKLSSDTRFSESSSVHTAAAGDVQYKKKDDSDDEFPMDLLEELSEVIDIPTTEPIVNNQDVVIEDIGWQLDEPQTPSSEIDWSQPQAPFSDADWSQPLIEDKQEPVFNHDYEKVEKKDLYLLDSNKNVVKHKDRKEDLMKIFGVFGPPPSMTFSWVGIVNGTESTKEKKIQPSYSGQKVFVGGFKYDDLKNLSLPVDQQIELFLRKFKKKRLSKKERESFKMETSKRVEELIDERIGEIKRILSSFGEIIRTEDYLRTNGYIFVVYKMRSDAEGVVKSMKKLNTRQATVKRSKEYLKSIEKDPVISPTHDFYVRWPKYYIKKLEKRKLKKKEKKKQPKPSS